MERRTRFKVVSIDDVVAIRSQVYGCGAVEKNSIMA